MASIGGDSRSTESLTLCAWVEQACLNALLNQHAWGYVCEGLDQHKLVLPGRGIRKDAACLTADQVRNILGIVENPWRLMFACAALLGLRAGEILGLRVEDVDLQNRTLNVSQGAWRGKLQTTKNTASENARPIPLPLDRFFREYLKTWKLNPLGLLFCNRNGRAHTSQKVVEYHLWPLLDALNIKRAGFHAFLHAHATLLLQGGGFAKSGTAPAPSCRRKSDIGHLCSSRRGNAPRSS